MFFSSESRGIVRLRSEVYGTSSLGAPLRFFPSLGPCRLLVVAAIHGEEPETTFLLSRSLRVFNSNFKSIAFVLCANPDGMELGTRGNANGVDLNRNFPTANWTSAPVGSRSILEAPRDTLLSPGTSPASEPETRALVDLVNSLQPETILSLHAPMGCVDAPHRTPCVERLENAFNLAWRPDIGYPTPGSLGTWSKERGLECITLELPRLSLEHMFERYGESFAQFLEASDA